MTEHLFDFHNTKIFYRLLGEEDAERLLVCVHGLTGNSTDCVPLGQRLVSEGYRVAVIDMPGRGKSDLFQNAEDYSYKIYMDVLHQFLDEINASNYALDWYGISMGGLLGIRFAGMADSPIERLILNDIGPVVPESDLDLIREYLKLEYRFETFEEFRDFLKQGRQIAYGNLPEELWTELARNNVWQDKDGLYVPAFDRNIDLMFDKEPIGELDLWPFWDLISARTLAIRGGKSTLFPLSVLEDMQKRKPEKLDVITFDECGHVPPILEPKQISPVVDWLKKL